MTVPELRLIKSDDFGRLINLKSKIFHQRRLGSHVYRKIYDWGLCTNPYKREEFPIGFALESDRDIIGAVVLIPARYKIANKNMYACFEVDLMVEDKFRFHGLRLLNQVWHEKYFPLVISTTPNRVSFEIECRMGAKAVTFTNRKYLKILNYLKTAKLILKNFKSRNILAWTIANFKSVVDQKANKINTEEDFCVEEIIKFDDRFNLFYEESSENYDVMHIRDSRYLNWRYVHFPFGERKIFSILDKKHILRGYIVIQKEITKNNVKKANIIDLFTKKNDLNAMRRLARIAIEYSKDRKLDRIEIMPTNIFLEPILQELGFAKIDMEFPRCLYKCAIPEATKIIENMHTWFISSGDGDNSINSALPYL